MQHIANCPSCKRWYQYTIEQSGKKCSCSSCGCEFVVGVYRCGTAGPRQSDRQQPVAKLLDDSQSTDASCAAGRVSASRKLHESIPVPAGRCCRRCGFKYALAISSDGRIHCEHCGHSSARPIVSAIGASHVSEPHERFSKPLESLRREASPTHGVHRPSHPTRRRTNPLYYYAMAITCILSLLLLPVLFVDSDSGSGGTVYESPQARKSAEAMDAIVKRQSVIETHDAFMNAIDNPTDRAHPDYEKVVRAARVWREERLQQINGRD